MWVIAGLMRAKNSVILSIQMFGIPATAANRILEANYVKLFDLPL
jgi:hypothetical protein